ncbi:hypothetical protein RI367_007923 [Sorochytrium milnesiophthora]
MEFAPTHLPVEVVMKIIAAAGLKTCIAVRYVPALYAVLGGATLARRCAVFHLVVTAKWGAGVDYLLRRQDGDNLAKYWRTPADVEGVTLSADTIKHLWVSGACKNMAVLATLAMNRPVDDELLSWFATRSRAFSLAVCAEQLRRGDGDVARLRALCCRVDLHFDDAMLARHFIHAAAKAGLDGTVQYLQAHLPSAYRPRPKAQESREPRLRGLRRIWLGYAQGTLEAVAAVALENDNDIVQTWATSRSIECPTQGQLKVMSLPLFQCAVSLHLDSSQLTDLYVRCAQVGRQDMVEWMLDTRPQYASARALVEAKCHGHDALTLWLVDRLQKLPCVQELHASVCQWAIKEHWVDLLPWHEHLRRDQLPPPEHQLWTCITDDVREMVLEFLDSFRVQMADLVTACKHGQLEIARRIYRKLGMPTTNDVTPFQQAVQRCHTDVVKWIHYETGMASPNFATVMESLRPKMDVAKELYEAARDGHASKVCALLDHATEDSVTAAVDVAAANGHLDVLQAMQQAGCAFTELTMSTAATHGHLCIVRFMHQHYPHLQCLPYGLDAAVEQQHSAVLQYLLRHNLAECTTDALDAAALQGDLVLLEQLHAHCSERYSRRAVRVAAHKGLFCVVRWLAERFPESVTPSAISSAVAAGWDDIAQYLRSIPS